VQYSACVRHLLTGKGRMKKMNILAACEECVEGRWLCARLRVSDDEEVELAVYQLPDDSREDVEWKSLNFWVRT
jgi:hypothetical protein